jgi:ribosomal peptide maturation radical SAM protein 1
MPFGPLLEPSLGLSLLKAKLLQEGYSANVLYLTLPFARVIGVAQYSAIAAGAPHSTSLVGEWIFSADVFGPENSRSTQQYVDLILKGGLDKDPSWVNGREAVTDSFVTAVLEARAAVGSFLETAAEQVLEIGAPVVGFTSVFQQQLASLALAKRLKAHVPELVVVFGGANCEGEMGVEIVRQFPFVDMAVSGEGEEVIVPIVKKALASDRLISLPGVYTRSRFISNVDGCPTENLENAPRPRSLDDLPYPRFDDFYAQVDALGLSDLPESRLLFESARGCWWGEKHHCTFCGLNGASMAFRSKSPQRVQSELLQLVESYPGKAVSFVDNILDMRYFTELLPQLAEAAVPLDLFIEVKANLRREQVQLLREAGITQIQPGVESLSTHVLKLMRKGVTALQNIQLLKWCKEYSVTPHWNILWGFPGEEPYEYRRMADLMPFLYHLPPPTGGAMIRLDRFSPNYVEAQKFGFAEVQPFPAYQHIYSGLSSDTIARLAYFFSFEYLHPQEPAQYVGPVSEEITRWRAAYDTCDLFWVDKGDRLVVWDSRGDASQPLSIVDGLHKAVLLACDVARPPSKLAEMLALKFGSVSVEQVMEVLGSLQDLRLVITEGGRWLSLGIPLGIYTPSPATVECFLKTIRSLGQSKDGATVVVSERIPSRLIGGHG